MFALKKIILWAVSLFISQQPVQQSISLISHPTQRAVINYEELFAACRADKVALVADLIRQGTFVNVVELFAACHADNADIVADLICEGAFVNIVPGKGDSLLHMATLSDNAQVCQIVTAAGADLEMHEPRFGHTPLHTACKAGNGRTCKILLAAGADVNARDSEENTPLHIAVLKHTNDVSDMIIQLLQAGADINAHNTDKKSPLYFGFPSENNNIFRNRIILLEHGAEYPVCHHSSFFPLCDTCNSFEKQCPPLLYAIINSTRLMWICEPVILMVSIRGHVEQAKRNVLLRYAVTRGDVDLVKKLLACGASPLARDSFGMSTINIAWQYAFQDTWFKQAEYRKIYTELFEHLRNHYDIQGLGDLPHDIIELIMHHGVQAELFAWQHIRQICEK